MKINDPAIRVKIVTRSGTGEVFPWAAQCPGGIPRWGNCEFISDPHCRDYDWLVVLDDIPRSLAGHKEILVCPASNTLLVTSEPSSVTKYGKAFAAQFAKILTSQEEDALPHPDAMRSPTGNIWFYGKSYDEISATTSIPKSQLVSTVCSSKRQPHTMHARRYDFTQRLKADIPEMEIFGHGVRYIENKYEALDPYKFHLVIENHHSPYLWTEKLADTFLACSVPIYCGCKNVFDYFPEDSLIQIDIDDYDNALQTIRSLLLSEGEYERRLDAILEARRRVLTTYNFPAMIHDIVNTQAPSDRQGAKIIYSRRVMRTRSPKDLLNFLVWKSAQALKKLLQNR